MLRNARKKWGVASMLAGAITAVSSAQAGLFLELRATSVSGASVGPPPVISPDGKTVIPLAVGNKVVYQLMATILDSGVDPTDTDTGDPIEDDALVSGEGSVATTFGAPKANLT